MITLTPELLAELALTITRPGYLIELGYSTPIRLSTIGSVSYATYNWTSADAKVSGIKQDGKGNNSASLTLGNTDNFYSALILNEGASDIPVSIYAVYAGAHGDAVQVFSGVADGAEIATDNVTMTLVAQANKTLFCPRVFISTPVFNFLQPEGTIIMYNGERFSLDRAL